MNITFIPGLTFDEQIAAWMNGTEDEYRMARWVSENGFTGADARRRELWYVPAAGLGEGFDHGREQGRHDAEEELQDG